MTTLSRMFAVMIALSAMGAVVTGSPAAADARGGCDRQARGRVATLDLTDNGRTVCTRRGQRINVVLRVDPTEASAPEQWWQPVDLSGRALSTVPMTVMPMRGTTLASFQATSRGTAQLSSTRSICPPPAPGRVTCEAMMAWWVRVTVR